MIKKQTKKVIDKEIIEYQKEIQKVNQLHEGLEFSVIDVKLIDGYFDAFSNEYGGSVPRVKFRDNKEGQIFKYLGTHDTCQYGKCRHYLEKLGKDVQGIHTSAHYNSGSVEMEVESSYTYDHFDLLTFGNSKFYFTIIPNLNYFHKKISKLREKVNKDYSKQIKRLKREQNKLKEIDYESSENLEERILELKEEKEKQKKAKEEMNKLDNGNYKEYILSHIAKFKEYVTECLDESISSIQDSIEEKKLELEELKGLKMEEEGYSNLFK